MNAGIAKAILGKVYITMAENLWKKQNILHRRLTSLKKL